MDKVRQEELTASLRLIDDQAKPLAGSYDNYTRLALIGMKCNGPDRFFVLFAESTRLFNAVHDALATPDWIREGFENKWIYIEEVLKRPGPTDDINGYLKQISQQENDLWIGIYNYVIKLGILADFARLIKSKTYGLPQDGLK